ncbi:MAG: PEGA domain-containing protein [Candidatus Scalindua sp.]|jgi:hypothetical protein|nr:PEGA domain-containing protein [Candidatus Scalindua sp.]MDV5167195.1 PEGA domain-containing protein [Candidatus Scalindua sp.]
MLTKSTKSYRHCPKEEYEISIFICRGRQKAHYPKCPECEFRTIAEEVPPIPAKKVKKKPLPPATLPKTGSIMVKSVPPSAAIFLDDENIGVTPAIITQIFPGKYRIKIKMDEFNIWSQSVVVKANKETSLTAVLQGRDCSVAIESKPTKAEVYIDGDNMGVTPFTIDDVKPGKHLVEVKLDRYEVWSEEIDADAKKKTSITAELTTKFGSISLNSEPDKAKIFLDGIEVGITPASLSSVLHGDHMVEIRLDGYSAWEKSVTVVPARETVLTAKLQVNTGSVTVKSNPENAKIYLDGKPAGTTPEAITCISLGIHEIKVEMEKYDVWTGTANIEAGKDDVITAVLQRSTGSLMVESNPPNAIIFVDGKEIGHTPEIIMSSAKGTHAIEVRMEGYDVWKQTVDIVPGDEKSLTAVLQTKTGSLIVNSKPSGSTIIFDGKESGTTPGSLEGLKTGGHQIELKKDGYKTWSESIEIYADKENKITAALLLLTGSLNIKSEPANATILVDGKEAGNTLANITDVIPGKHLVEVKMDGYEVWSESIDVNSSKENLINAVLQKSVASVNIKSEPTNAKVIVDGKEVGNTPLDVSDIKPGKHLVEVKMDRFKNWRENIEINAGKENNLTAVLQQLVASINIKSEPANATILVDGKEAGNTPAVINDIKPGKYLVEVKMEEYEIWSKKVKVEIGKDIDLTAVLQLKAGSFTIVSEPVGATAYIDDKEVGTTPLIINAPSPGKHSIEARMDGYETWSRSIDFVQGKEITLTATLQIKTGTVSITSEPANAITFIDSKEVGKTPITLTDPSTGTHTVELMMDGYETWNKSVDFVEGKETVIATELQMKAGSISISSNPTGAFIKINGKKSGNTPETINDLSPGTHLAEIRMDGYEDWSESVDIKGDKINKLVANLLEITGSININSNPPEAAIYLNGEKAGITPDTLKSVTIGSHEIEIKMEGFAGWKKTLNVKKGKEINLNATLEQNTGTANIESDPTDAVVLLDANDFGKTPVNLTDIKIGIYDVEIQKEGYVSCKKTIKIKAGKVSSLTAKLVEMTGSVNVNSNPSNAVVFVDSKKIGNTPANITDIAAGNYQLEVKMDGYDVWSDSVNIHAGKDSTVTAELQTKSGSVNINSNPSKATIFIDSKEVGTTPKNVTDLSYDNHLLEVKMDGYEAWSENIEMEPGLELSVVAELQMIAGSVCINSEPSNAMILINNKKAGFTPKTLTEILPGEHNVEIRMDGFENWSESVEVRSDKQNSIAAVLRAITGSINIESNPSEATIFLDGKEVSTTPDTITHATIGIHEIEVKMEGHAEWKKKINVKQGKEIALNAVLHPVTGSVRLESEPTGAVIIIDGEDVGKTPEDITGLSPGKHEVEMRLEGYDSSVQMIKVKNGKESLFSATLQRKKGSLMLISNPANALIYLEGKKSGRTPSTITELTPGKYTIELSLDNYQTWSENADIVPGEEITITAELQEKPGSISIKSKPSDARIFIDGNEAGTTPETIKDIECGDHIVKLVIKDYCDWSENIEITDKECNITATLQEKLGSIDINSEPFNATIFFNGNKIGSTPEIIQNVKPGVHQVEVRADGFENWSESVEVAAEGKNIVTAILQKASGSINIKSTPESAKVFIDDKEVGITPAVLSSIPIGEHDIVVQSGGYECWKKSVIIKKDKELSLNAVLQVNIGSINIESYPENAKIYIDGNEVGNAPKQLIDITVGTHEVEVVLEGYVKWEKSIKVKPGKETSLSADLKKIDGVVDVKSDKITKTPEVQKPSMDKTSEMKAKPEKVKEKPVKPPKKSKPPSGRKKVKYSPDKIIKLRWVPEKISASQIESLPYITINEKNNNIYFCHSSINHHYELKPIGNGDVVIDHATELMWYQAGSSEYFNFKKANKWLKAINKKGYAGFDDWRLPTLEEASSLLESSTESDKFIDSIFEEKQWGTWTGDKSDKGHAWIVTYVNGTISEVQAGTPATFVRPVRTSNI